MLQMPAFWETIPKVLPLNIQFVVSANFYARKQSPEYSEKWNTKTETHTEEVQKHFE